MAENEIKVDLSTMPSEIKGDIMKEAQWKEEEKNRLTAESLEKSAGGTTGETEEQKTAKLEAERLAAEETEKDKKPIKLDLSEFKEFGEFKSKDDIKAQLKELGLTKVEITKLNQQIEEEKGRLAQFIEKSKENPFNDPDLYRLNHIKRETPNDYDFYKKVVMGGLDGFELIKTQFLKDNPKITPEKADIFLRDKYGLDEEYDMEIPAEKKEREINETSLLLETERIKKDILNKFSEIKVPEPTIIDEEKVKLENATKLEEQRTKARKVWSPLAEKIVKSFDKLPILITGEGEEKTKEFMDYIIPEETKKELTAQVLDYLTDKPLTEDSINEAKAHVRLVYLINHLPEINTAYGDKVRAMNDEEWQKLKTNPSALNSKSNKEKEKGKTDGIKWKDTQQAVMEKFGIQ